MSNNLSNYVGMSWRDTFNEVEALIAAQLLTVNDILFPADVLTDGVIIGFQTVVPMSNSFVGVMTVSAGGAAEAVVFGNHIVIPTADSRLTFTYASNSDTYNDVDTVGTIHHTAVANNANPPSIVADSIRLEKVITGASGITGVQNAATFTNSSSSTSSAMAGFATQGATNSAPQINQLWNTSILPNNTTQNQGPLAAPADFMQNQLITGFALGSSLPSSGLGFTFTGNSNGVTILVIQGNRIVIPDSDSRLTFTYSANSDTYLDIDNMGNFHPTAVGNGASAPAVFANSTRILKVVSGTSTITSIVFLISSLFVPNLLGPLVQNPHQPGVYTAPQNQGPLADVEDFTQDSVVFGFQTAIPGGTSLTGTMNTSGGGWAVAFVHGNRVAIPVNDPRLTYVYTASKDTYNDIDINGNITHTAVANNASAPSLASNSSRLEKVVTNGSTIVSTQNYGYFTNSGGISDLASAGFTPFIPVLAPGQINQMWKTSIALMVRYRTKDL